MTGVQLGKIFAWAIGVLSLLWLLAQCMGAGDPTDEPEQRQIERDAERYVADCRRTWEALDLMGEADHENVVQVVDEIDLLASEIYDPELAEMAFSFGVRAEEMILYSEPDDAEQLEENYQLFRGLVEIDLSMRCTAATM